MLAKLEEYLEIFHAEDFHDIVISRQEHRPLLVIRAYEEISKRFDYPLHPRRTHAGPKETGTIRSVVRSATCWPAASATRSAYS